MDGSGGKPLVKSRKLVEYWCHGHWSVLGIPTGRREDSQGLAKTAASYGIPFPYSGQYGDATEEPHPPYVSALELPHIQKPSPVFRAVCIRPS